MKTEIEQLIDRLASKELTFGCIVRARGVGIWQQSASLFYYRAVEEMSLSPDAADQRSVYCGFKPYSKVKFSCCGFQQYLQGWKETNKYPKTIEVYKPLLGSEYKVAELADVHEGKLEILGHPILIGDVLEKLEEHFAWGYRETSKKALASTTKYEDKTVAKLWRLWKACGGADKSLQEIVADTEWAPEQQPNGQPKHVIGSRILLVPKQPKIRNLFEFLLSLNLTE